MAGFELDWDDYRPHFRRLPSRRELAAAFGVAPMTVQSAPRELRAEGSSSPGRQWGIRSATPNPDTCISGACRPPRSPKRTSGPLIRASLGTTRRSQKIRARPAGPPRTRQHARQKGLTDVTSAKSTIDKFSPRQKTKPDCANMKTVKPSGLSLPSGGLDLSTCTN
nr:GntR family transcriptional regulator [Prauserella marina]